MARIPQEKSLRLALEYRDLLLYEISGGNMGKKPKSPLSSDRTTFAEKKAFLDSMLKAAELARKSKADLEEEGLFTTIRRNTDASRANGSGGDTGREKEDPTPASSFFDLDSGADTDSEEESDEG